jgi:hypothetical protein
MNKFLHQSWILLVAVALAALGGLVCSATAVAQQPRNPTELWEEYPLDPTQERSRPGASDQRDPSDHGPAVGNDGGVVATDEEQFPLLAIVLAVGLVLLGATFSMGVLVRSRRAPARLRDGSAPTPHVARRLPDVDGEVVAAEPVPISQIAEPVTHTTRSKNKPSPPAKPPDRAKLTRSAKPLQEGKPAKSTKPVVAAKPAGAVSPPKPVRPAKPKPVRPAKPKSATPRTPVAQDDVRGRGRITSPFTERRRVNGRSPSLPADAPVARKLSCSIFGSRNGQIADFYALGSGPSGHKWIVARSPRFEWVAGDIPAEAYQAHAILVDELLQSGWHPAGFEGAWYRQRFERTLRPPTD